MTRTALLALAAVFAFSGLPAQAQDDGIAARPQDSGAADDNFTGQALKDACVPATGLDKNARALADQVCQSYLRGLTEGLFLQAIVAGSGTAVCLPKDGPISVEEARTDILNYLADNPDAATHEAGVAGVLALVKAHGCGGD